MRQDALHKISHQISKNHALIVMEDLQVKNMTKSAKGTKEHPGKNVAQKSGLNQSILNQGWKAFQNLLNYKASWRGGFIVLVPPQYTSQTCPCCGHISKENRMTQDNFTCVHCGYHEHADVVGAKNVLQKGLNLLSS